MNKRSILLITALFLASLNLRMGISSVSPILETIRSELEMSGLMSSLLTSIPVLCMGLFSPLAVKLGVRYGLERILLYALILIGVGTGLRAFTFSTWYLLLTAFFIGIGIAASGPLLSGFIKKYFPLQVAPIIGVYSFSMALGMVITSGTAVSLQNILNGSWRLSLAFWAIFILLVLPIWWFVVLRKSEIQQPAASSANGRLPWRNKRAWLLTLFSGLTSSLYFSAAAWLAPAAESMGFSKIYAGCVATAFVLVQIPASMLIPLLVQRFSNRFVWLAGCCMLELAGFVLMGVITFSPWAATALIGIGAGGLFPLALLLTIDETSNPQDASTWTAMTQLVGYIIASMGPLLVGWIHDSTGTYVFSFISLIIICVICILLASLITAKRSTSPIPSPKTD